MLTCRGPQHSREGNVGKGESQRARGVEGGCWVSLCPACKLIDSLAKIPGRRCQGLHRGVRLVDRQGERETGQITPAFDASSCWLLLIMGTKTSSEQCTCTVGYKKTHAEDAGVLRDNCGDCIINSGQSHGDVTPLLPTSTVLTLSHTYFYPQLYLRN